MLYMSWKVKIKKKVFKNLRKLPPNICELFEELVVNLQEFGPIRGDWPNYSKLVDGSHHCHLNYSYVVVWIVLENEVKIMEVTYVGSRENAPY